MAFHHSPDGKAHFGKPGMAKKPMPKPEHEKKAPEAPHGEHGEQHVTKTHPGMTEPHPKTGVHAFHSFHAGGGRYHSHTHHGDGTVEKREHPDANDLHRAHEEAMPPEESEMGMEPEGDYATELGGVGGAGGEESSY